MSESFDDQRFAREQRVVHTPRDGDRHADSGAVQRRAKWVLAGLVAVIVAVFLVLLVTDDGSSNNDVPEGAASVPVARR